MLNRLKNLLAPPAFADEEQSRRARLLFTALYGVTAAILVVMPLTVLLLPPGEVALRLSGSAVALAAVLGLALLARRGHLRLVSALLPSALLAVLTFIISRFGGLSSPAVVGYTGVIVIAGLLLGGHGVIVFTVLTGAVALSVLFAQSAGWIAPFPPPTGVRLWLVHATGFGLMGLLMYLAVRGLREGLDHARYLRDVEADRARELASLLAVEHKRAQQFRLIAGVARRLVGYDDPQALLEEAVRRLHDDFGFEYVSLFLISDGSLVRRAAYGPVVALISSDARVPLGRGIIGRVGQTGQTYLTNNTAADEYFVPLPGANIAAELAVPLRLEGNVIGVLNVESEKAGAFDATDVSTLEALADLLAAGLRASQLAVERRARARRQEALVRLSAVLAAALDEAEICRRVVNGLCDEALGYTHIGLFLLDERTAERVMIAGTGWPEAPVNWRIPPGRGLSDRAVRDGRLHYTPDVTRDPDYVPGVGTGAEVDAPIWIDGKVQGVLVVESVQPHAFTRDDFEVITAVANQAGLALGKARLLAEIQRRAEHQARLNAITRAALETTDIAHMLQVLADQLGELINADGCSITLWDEAQQRVIPAAAYGELREVYPTLVPQPDEATMTASVLKAGCVLVAEDVFNTPDLSPRLAAPRPTRSMLGLPLIAGDQKLGAALIGFNQPHHFTPDEIALGEQAARQIALALAKARALEAEYRQRELAEALRDVGAALSASLDFETVLDCLLDQIARVVTYDTANIMLVENGRARHARARGYEQFGEEVARNMAALSFEVAKTENLRRMVETGQPLIIPDTSTFPGWVRVTTSTHIHSWAGVPVLVRGEAIAFFSVGKQAPNFYRPEDAERLAAFAGHAALALQNARLFTATAEALAREQRLNEVARTLSSMIELPSVLQTVVRLAAEVVGAEAGALGLIAPDGETITYPYLFNLPEGLRLQPTPKGHGLAWQIVTTGESVLQPEYGALPNALPAWVEAGIHGFIGVPVVAGEARIGAMGLFALQPRKHFTPRDLALAESIGRQAGLVIQNARLFEAEQRRAEEQRLLFEAARDFAMNLSEDAVLRTVGRHMVGALNVADCVVSLWEPEQDRVVTWFDYALPDDGHLDRPGTAYALADYPATRRVLESRQPLLVRVDDPAADPAEVALMKRYGQVALLMLPLGTGDSVFGLIELGRRSGAPSFSEADIRLAQGLAAQAAVALENARLHTTVQERVRELDALLTANTAMLGTLDLDPLLDNILQAALAAIPAAEKGTILLAETVGAHHADAGERPRLQIRAVAGYTDPRVRTFTFAGSEGYSAKAMREKRPLLISDARADPDIRYDGDIPEVREILSAIVAPLRHHDQPLGVISLDATRLSAFTEADLRLLVAFANAAAVAIDNARLHAEVRALAVTDGLTGLTNHRAFHQALETEVARAGRYDYPVSLVFLDIDSFKLYNDTYGHPAGNERLKAIAALLRERVRESDLVARYGGEEFALLLPYTPKDGALCLAERIRAAAEASAPEGVAPGVPASGYTLSLGVATFPDDARTSEGLLLAADNAELAAKRAGKNRVMAAGPPAEADRAL